MDVTQFTMADTPMMTLVKRSIFYGLMSIIAGHIAKFVVEKYMDISALPQSVKNFNEDYTFEIILAVTGFILFFGIHYLRIKY